MQPRGVCFLNYLGADYRFRHYLAHSLALLTFTFSGEDASSKPVTMQTLRTEAGFSYKGLGVSGEIMLAGFLPKCQYV
jgi:hypothetical protein